MQIEDVGATRNPAFSGMLLREARVRRGWSQGRLAAHLDAALRSIAGYERGVHAPPPPMLVRMASALGIAPGELLTVPRTEWTLAEYRAVTGFHQQDAAVELGITQDRLSRLESAYERGSDELFERMAALYPAEPEELRDAWERSRSRLLDDDENDG